MKFYYCEDCHQVVIGSENLTCCSKKMKELVPGVVEASLEKHIPKVTTSTSKVSVEVGEVLHPMTEEHYIEFICLTYKDGYSIKYLKPGMEPKADFNTSETPVAVYAYCNLHGLWKKDI